MNKNGKVWGSTRLLFQESNVEIHRICIRAGTHCSRHKHEHKFNAFYVERGRIKVEVWKNDYDLLDSTELGPDEMTTVAPGEYHRFVGVEESVVYEIYWVSLDPGDIVRDGVGGLNEHKEVQ